MCSDILYLMIEVEYRKKVNMVNRDFKWFLLIDMSLPSLIYNQYITFVLKSLNNKVQ